MPQLLVRNIDEKLVRELKARAGRHGVSAEEEHRQILQEALSKPEGKKPSFKEYLKQMPDVGGDELFERQPQTDRPVEL
jgi:antitoxin FitA